MRIKLLSELLNSLGKVDKLIVAGLLSALLYSYTPKKYTPSLLSEASFLHNS